MGSVLREILLAEDDETIAHLYKTQLQRHGFHVTSVRNGREALNIIRSKPVDLLITDVVMPEMDGVDLYMELKNNPATAQLPVIIITDKKMFQDSFAALGVDFFVDKGKDTSVLIDKVFSISRQHQETRKFHKVLICSSHPGTPREMQAALVERGCLVDTVPNPIDIVSRALLMNPHFILIDLMIDSDITTVETIRALRCYQLLSHSRIITYLEITPADIEEQPLDGRILAEHIKTCEEAGAARYLGRYNRVAFHNLLKEFNIGEIAQSPRPRTE